jgi:hypothetical protein
MSVTYTVTDTIVKNIRSISGSNYLGQKFIVQGRKINKAGLKYRRNFEKGAPI